MPAPPSIRVRTVNDRPINPDRSFVLYWMTAFRRLSFNFALDHAIEYARSLDRPLVVLEALRCGYRWRCDRFHAFVLDGMADNLQRLEDSAITYYPYVEPNEGHGSGLLEALASEACVVVTDDYPCFFLPRMVEAARAKLDVRLDAIDSNGLYPVRATDRVFTRAHDFRRHLHRELADHLASMPEANPLHGVALPMLKKLPTHLTKRWPPAMSRLTDRSRYDLASLPLDHTIGLTERRGGTTAGRDQWRRFRETGLEHYADDRNDPDKEGTSGLSPYLHFGYLSIHEVFSDLAEQESWSLSKIQGRKATGSRSDWWQMSEPTESFLDEIVTWREVGFNMTTHRSNDYSHYDSLPDWAKKTLEDHRYDDRPHHYSLEQLDAAQTHDELWNAAQNQLRTEGAIHNYMRMLWGKKILQWSASPEEALDNLIELNNKYALDGRDPNSYSGIFWCLGRYDRAWGPERPIFGKIRYMSSESARNKFPSLKNYIRRYQGTTS